MKNSTRTLTVIICLLIGTIANAARNGQNHSSPRATAINPVQNMTNSMSPFYTEDFASGLPASWQAIDSAGNGLNWKYTTTGSHDGTSLSSTGTSAANGYMIYDSDSAGGLSGPDKADLISGPINCSTHPNVHLNFNEFLTFYNDTALVYVSNDGTNWTMVHNSSSGLAQYSSTPNPNNVDFDISAIAANHDSVWIRFSYHADYSYYWMIDDVNLYEVAQQDGAMSGITAPGSSCNILSNSEPISIAVFNQGGAAINNCLVTYIVDGGTAVVDTDTTSIAVGATQPFTFSTHADLSAPGTHTIVAYVTVAGDTNAANDTARSTIFTGSHLIDQVNNYTNGFEPNQDLSTTSFQDGNADSITWVLSTAFPHSGTTCALLQAPVADDWVFTTCLDLDSGEYYGLSYFGKRLSTAFQANLQIGIGMQQNPSGMGQLILSNGPFTSVAYHQGVHLFSVPITGTYYIGFEVSNADSAVGFALDDINVYWNNGNGIRENLNDKITIYPNPSNGYVYLNSHLNAKNGFKVEITNSLGELVNTFKSESLNNYRLDMSGYNSGLYVIRIITDEGISTHKLTVSN